MYLVPDTNVFLECKHFDDVDWREITGEKDVVLVVLPKVIHELDVHKFSHHNKKKAEKARKLLKRIEQLIDNNENTKKGLPVIMEYGLEADGSSSYADDVIIAEVLALKRGHPDEKVVLASADTGMGLNAQSKGIDVLKIEDFLRETLVDERDEKIRKLTEELQRLKNQQPRLYLTFPGGDEKNIIDFSEFDEQASDHKFMEGLVEKEISEAIHKARSFGHYLLDKNDSEILAYRKEYREYLEAVYNYNRTTFCLSFELHNSGTAVAEDILVFLNFPETIELSEFPFRAVKRPRRPYSFSVSHQFPDTINSLMGTIGVDKDNWILVKPKDHQVSYSRKIVQHNLMSTLEKIHCRLATVNDRRSFSIDYTIHAKWLLEQKKGTLNIIFGNSK